MCSRKSTLYSESFTTFNHVHFLAIISHMTQVKQLGHLKTLFYPSVLCSTATCTIRTTTSVGCRMGLRVVRVGKAMEALEKIQERATGAVTRPTEATPQIDARTATTWAHWSGATTASHRPSQTLPSTDLRTP